MDLANLLDIAQAAGLGNDEIKALAVELRRRQPRPITDTCGSWDKTTRRRCQLAPKHDGDHYAEWQSRDDPRRLDTTSWQDPPTLPEQLAAERDRIRDGTSKVCGAKTTGPGGKPLTCGREQHGDDREHAGQHPDEGLMTWL